MNADDNAEYVFRQGEIVEDDGHTCYINTVARTQAHCTKCDPCECNACEASAQ